MEEGLLESINLSHVTAADLVAELRRREMAMPEPVQSPNWEPVIALIHADTKKRAVGIDPGDHKHKLYSLVLTAVYGMAFWNWWNREDIGGRLPPL